MRIGVPSSTGTGETLVAATPDTVKKLIKLGYTVQIETGAGLKASYPDSQYREAGATIVDHISAWSSDVILALDAPSVDSVELNSLIRPGATLICRMAPGRNPELLDKLLEKKVLGMAMDMVPRISRAQSMDVLSSLANVAGYRAVIEGANAYGRTFGGQVTAAGKMPPARVYVIGVGVAGLAAIGTAANMGAQVFATDVRPETAEQAESVGAKFVPVPIQQEKSADGYAKAMTEEQAQAAAKLYAEQAALSDIVITTANIPGRKAPVLLDEAAVAQMKPGSVIVDMAAATGGNCTLTRPGECYVTGNGVTIIGYTDLPGRLPAQSSQLYGQNIFNLFKLLTPEKDGIYSLDLNDAIVRSITVTDGEELLYPPPRVDVSAAASPSGKPELSIEEKAEKARKESEEKARKRRTKLVATGLAALIGSVLMLVTPLNLVDYFVILMLACVVGYYVITNVTHSLHTPLMSETNAISGIIMVGALVQIPSPNWAVKILAFIALTVASINVFGGFAVTHRMLSMFRKDDK